MAARYFTDENSKKKYYFKIFDLDYNDPNTIIDKSFDAINEWTGDKYDADLYINISVDDEAFLPSRVVKELKNAIAKIISSTYTIITTNGVSKGTTRIIGETISRTLTMSDSHINERNIKLLGIVKWNRLMFYPNFTYDFDQINEEGDVLDRNHSHYILFKNDDSDSEVKYCAGLQKKLNETNLTIMISLNGKNKILETILSTIEAKVPVLLIRESKGSTDFLADVIIKFNELSLDDKKLLVDEKNLDFVAKFYKGFSKEMEKREYDLNIIKSIIDLYHTQIATNNIVLIDHLNFNDYDLQTAVLKLLTIANNDDESEEQKRSINILSLALKWNKMKIASSILDSLNESSSSFDSDRYYELMETSLTENRPEFFKLFMDEFQTKPRFMAEFLTPKRLYYLYNFKNREEDVKEAPFSVIFKRKEKKFFSFKYIRNEINKLGAVDLKDDFISMLKDVQNFETSFNILDSFSSAYINGQYETEGFEALIMGNSMVENYCANIFIWAIMFNRIEIAKIVLLTIENQIGFALLASIILRAFYIKTNENSFLKSSDHFEDIAIEILNLFDIKESDEYNFKLLLSDIKCFRSSLLQMAYTGRKQKFVTSIAVQKCLLELRNNGFIDKEDCRIVSDSNQLEFHKFSFKHVISYLTLGLTAPFFFYRDENGKHNNDQIDVVTSPSTEPILNDKAQESEHLVKKNKHKTATYSFKYENFIFSPKTSFFYETWFYLLFLFTFSYLMLCDFVYVKYPFNDFNLTENNTRALQIDGTQTSAQISWIEYLVTFWVFSFFCRIIFEIIVWRKRNIWNQWNHFSTVGCCLFLIGISVRIESILSRSYNAFILARVILCFDLCSWFFRSLYILMCYATLGPKLVMIRKMVRDLMSFIAILSIFLFSYGVTTHAIMFPASEFNLLSTFGLLVDISYWPIFGQITLLSILENKTFPLDAKIYGYFVTTIYMFIANALLINLLIAMFSNTFNNVEQNANEIWKFQNFKLIYEYRLNEICDIKLWPIPVPLNIINLAVFLIKLCFRKQNKKPQLELMSAIEDEAQAEIIEKIKSYSEVVLNNAKEK